MENILPKKRTVKSVYMLCPAAHTAGLLSLLAIALHLLMRQDHELMVRLSENVVRPLHRALALFNSGVSFSVAELLIVCTAAAVLLRLVFSAALLVRGRFTWVRLYKDLAHLVSLLLFIYAGFCLLWGTFYYGDDFAEKSGLSRDPVSVEQLETVTEYFAGLANKYGGEVARDENGFYNADRAELIRKSAALFDGLDEEYPCLAGPRVTAKPVSLSHLMSYIDFTGFFFPFTGEANVNTDFPPGLFASTVAHELSHQRGVAKEQEANFTAVLASLNYGDADYCYSAALLAYTHLGNALYSADHDAWARIYEKLDENILRDFARDRAYWKQFDTPAQSVSNTVYEGFLHSYDQTLGLKSYGACVDLLVNYYYDAASAASVGQSK